MKKPSLRRKILWTGIPALLAMLWWLWPNMGHELRPERAPSFPQASLTVTRADGQAFPFTVEVATTPRQHEYGLMFRRSLPENAGMLFVFDSVQTVAMWMKNTLVPLDLLFVRADGTIAKIAAHTEPLSLAPIGSDEPIKSVLEIAAGGAGNRGLKAGDRVLYPAFPAR